MKVLSAVTLLSFALYLTAESAVNFTRHDVNVNWTTAKSRCEALGQRLAVLDTEEKRTKLQARGISLSGGPWIGLHDPDENNTFVWLNGNPLPSDDESWSDGNPDADEEYCGYVKSSLEFADYNCAATGSYICETYDKYWLYTYIGCDTPKTLQSCFSYFVLE